MDEEIKCIENNQTWNLVDVPEDKDVISVKWIYKTKQDVDGNVQKHKVRSVARGFTQQPRIDFNETFVPVARMDTVITVLAIGVICFLYYLPPSPLSGEIIEKTYKVGVGVGGNNRENI
jgi:hypothetical protein